MEMLYEAMDHCTNGTLTCEQTSHQTWLLAIIASCAVGLSGVFPLAIIPVELGCKLNSESGDSKLLRLLLGFAVGGLLGDVFLHLLPEAWNAQRSNGGLGSHDHLTMGCWILAGIFTFIVVEMFAAGQVLETKDKNENSVYPSEIYDNGNQKISNGYHKNGSVNKCLVQKIVEDSRSIHISGYLNLIANAIDNFSHGLAVAASFLVSTKMGMLTTAAILIHEIPHEVGDFAILLKSGFGRWDAAKAQFSTALVGILGTVVALSANSLEEMGRSTCWILPFTAGGFLNIALVNILPDLMKEKDPLESFKQLLCIIGGIAIMGIVGIVTE